MSTIVIVLVVLVALVSVLLAAPVTVTLDVERVESFAARWRLRWAYGLVRVGSSESSRPIGTDQDGPGAAPTQSMLSESAQTRADDGDGPRAAQSTRRPHKKARAIGGRAILAMVRTPGFLARVGRFARALIGRVRIEHFRLRAAFGLSDPADTGMVYGLISPALLTASMCHFDVECQPLFDEADVKLTLKTSVRIVPLAVAMTVLAFLLSPSVIRALVAARRARSSW